MKNKKLNPFVNLILDDEEQVVESALVNDEYIDNMSFNDTKKMLKEAASRHLDLNKAKPITIRIKQLDLIKVKAKAKGKNIPYQTLLSILIHEYAEDEKIIKI